MTICRKRRGGLRCGGRWLLGVVLVAAICSRSVQARDIYLAIEAHESMTAYQVTRKFETAMSSTVGFNYKSISVEPIEPEAYQLLDSLVRRGLLATTKVKVGEDGALVEPLRGVPGCWAIHLGEPDSYLDSATLVLRAAGEDRTEELKPAGRDRAEARLRYHSPGCYVLHVGENISPQSMTLRVTNDRGEKHESVVSWPRAGRFYLVTLAGAVGDEANLFTSLQDPGKVGDPIRQIFPSTSTLIMGSFREKDPWGKPGFFALRLQQPAERECMRVWIRFPLTVADRGEVCQDLDQRFVPAKAFVKEVPAWLNKNKLKRGDKLKPGAASWVEVPFDAAENAFVVDVPVDIQAWQKLLQESPERVGDHAVLLWEWQDPKNPQDREIIRIGGAGGKRYQEWQFGWLQGLPGASLPKD
jgi:hypothetical protein